MFLLTAVDLKNASLYQGQPQAGKPDCTLTLADEDMVQIVSNQTRGSGVSDVKNALLLITVSGSRHTSVGRKSTAVGTLLADSFATNILTANLQDLCKCFSSVLCPLCPTGEGDLIVSQFQ
jgi:hypothetical protein